MAGMTVPVIVLLFLGILIAGLGLFAAGNIYVVGLGVACVVIAGILQVVGQRRS
jgi:hypothetical protein